MTDLLSPSPYAYLDDLSPAERQAEIARRQHDRREDWCDDARRARDYQAALAEANERVSFLAKEVSEWRGRPDAMRADKAEARIAELEGALEPFAGRYEKAASWFRDPPDERISAERFTIGDFRRARAALRNRV